MKGEGNMVAVDLQLDNGFNLLQLKKEMIIKIIGLLVVSDVPFYRRRVT